MNKNQTIVQVANIAAVVAVAWMYFQHKKAVK